MGCLWQTAKRLCICLAKGAEVSLQQELVVIPQEHLSTAAKETFQYLLTTFAFPGKVRKASLLPYSGTQSHVFHPAFNHIRLIPISACPCILVDIFLRSGQAQSLAIGQEAAVRIKREMLGLCSHRNWLGRL